ncbi:hypothetical protein X729_18365 [Mesorhizobium sp. L103C131B0]|nr:hypothetical protein X729_18365 [Mesorhizobium sp. L103C131B0]
MPRPIQERLLSKLDCEELTSVSLAEFDGAAAGASPSQDAEFYLLLGHILQVDGFGSKLARSIDDALGLAAKRPVRGNCAGLSARQ